jgi:hypothetical protein
MNLILTFDYELFGDGSGNVFSHMIVPTCKILDILDQNNIKSTIFFEVIEYWKIKEQWEKGNNMGYEKNPVLAIEKQLKDALKNGHDVQLHLHPQWLNAKWENDNWKVNKSMWRLGEFVQIDDYTLFDLLRDGKKTLEDLFISINPEYKCHTLRAGGYNILPSSNTVKAMKSLGFKCDSSVYSGGFEDGTLSKYDFKDVEITKDFWFVADDVRKDCGYITEIVELPIFALPSIRIKKLFSYHRLKSLLLNTGSSISSFSAKVDAKKSLLSKVLYLFKKEYLTWDFCLFSNAMHNNFLEECRKLNNKHDRNNFTIIGHPKNFVNPNSLKSLIFKSQSFNMSFITISDFYKNDIVSKTAE